MSAYCYDRYNHRLVTQGDWLTLQTAEHHALATRSRWRHLTPNEYARLQGFPAGWTRVMRDGVARDAISNAVCVTLFGWLGARV